MVLVIQVRCFNETTLSILQFLIFRRFHLFGTSLLLMLNLCIEFFSCFFCPFLACCQHRILQFNWKFVKCSNVRRLFCPFALPTRYQFLMTSMHIFVITHQSYSSSGTKVDSPTIAQNISKCNKTSPRGIIVSSSAYCGKFLFLGNNSLAVFTCCCTQILMCNFLCLQVQFTM